MLKVDKISKSYYYNNFPFFNNSNKKIVAIKDISFEIEEGDILGVIGQNGSGKSTLLKTIFGTITQDMGQITLKGDAKKIKNHSALLNNNDRSFFWRLTVEENLNYFCALQSHHIKHNKLNEVYGSFSIDELMNKTFMSLSSGQKKRVALYRGLLRDPELIFFDEFTESLDLKNQILVEKIVKDLLSKQLKKTIVWVTHSLDEIKNLCNKVLILENGEIKHFHNDFKGEEHQMDAIKSVLMK
mgnify:CR=1 FL=1